MTAQLFLFLLACALASAASSSEPDPKIWSGSLVEMKALLQSRSAHLDNRNPGSGQTPLMAACLRGDAEVVEYLLSVGADVSIPEKDGYTCPHGAGFQGRADVARVLIKRGIDVTEFHTDGFAPLHRACWGKKEGHAETVRVFLESGVDRDLKSNAPKAIPRSCKDMTTNPNTRAVLLGDKPAEL
ncbi:hypothetical protein TeGR_g4282 [Tetraparma gracilis]|uniref:Ankyrin repeat domain-containing protein n=1 Tax=Tetraparma gracilis TaxID=2962635 RepID=A0ABQ6N885_9STRA|nr:hypothetical protein TeGR_g4282 [Tetraparma gracilis]